MNRRQFLGAAAAVHTLDTPDTDTSESAPDPDDHTPDAPEFEATVTGTGASVYTATDGYDTPDVRVYPYPAGKGYHIGIKGQVNGVEFDFGTKPEQAVELAHALLDAAEAAGEGSR